MSLKIYLLLINGQNEEERRRNHMNSIKISKAVSTILPSATIAVTDRAEELIRKGIDIIAFAEGEPDFGTPDNIKKAADIAMQKDFTKYTAVAGIKELKEAICEKFQKENAIEYKPSQIIVSNGAKQALFNVFMTICDEGDHVLLPTPCYVSFIEQIKLAKATPILVPTKEENRFRITLDDIKSKYNPKVRGIILNSPNNPTGSVLQKGELEKIAKFCIEKKVLVITDEVYEKIIFNDNKHISIASLNDEIKDLTITVNSVSKSYAMNGWRLGYASGPEKIISAMIKLQGHVTGNVNSIAQRAAIEALNGSQDSVKQMVQVYTKRKKYVVEKLNTIRGISCYHPDGGFYVFPNITKLYEASHNGKKIKNELGVINLLLDQARVLVVPGKAFEYPDHFRLCFASSMDNLKQGLDRIEMAVEALNF